MADANVRTAHIRFVAEVNPNTVHNLISTIEQQLREGYRRLVLLISSPGGNVLAGVTAYNFLRGIPAEVVTHNIGSADSIAAVLYCGGSKRYCVPHGRFLLHGVVTQLQNGVFDEKFLDERVKSLQSDRGIISKIVAESCQKPLETVEHDMLQGTVLDATQAMKYGLVHETRSHLFEQGAEIIAVQ